MTAQQFQRERRWLVIFRARCEQVIAELQMAIAESQIITTRWLQRGIMPL